MMRVRFRVFRLQWVILLCGMLGLIGAGPSAAQSPPLDWRPLAGPQGRISLLAQQPADGALYAVAVAALRRRDDQTQWRDTGTFLRSDALYRSADLGVTWQPLSNNLPYGAITALYADPGKDSLYVGLHGTGDGENQRDGLWHSDDGISWRYVRLGRDDLHVRRIVRNAGGGQLIVAATDSADPPASYIYISRDDGETWSSVVAIRTDQGPGDVLYDLVVHPVEANRLYAATFGGAVYESADAGATWTRLTLPPDPGAAGPAFVVIDAATPRLMFVARTLGEGASARIAVARSADGGAAWRTLAATGLPERGEIATLAVLRDGALLLSAGPGSYRSTDRGETWQLLEGPLSSGSVAAFLQLSGAAPTIFAAGGYGLFASRDGGGIWQQQGSGLPANLGVTGMLTDARAPGVILAVADQQPAISAARPPVLLRSSDGGRTWSAAAQGLPGVQPGAWALDPADPNTVYLAGDGYFATSDNGGLTWQVAPVAPGARTALAVAPTDSNVIYLGGNPLLRSTDRGASWAAAPVAPAGQRSQPGNVAGLVVHPMDPQHLWAALDAGVYESLDGGATWREAGLAGKPLRWLAGSAEPQGSGVALTLYAGVAGEGVYRWDSGALQWEQAATGLPDGSTVLAFWPDPQDGRTLWAGRDGGGLYRSPDRGESWENVGDRLGENLVLALAGDPQAPGRVLIATATAGLSSVGTEASATERARQRDTALSQVDARIEIVWPHDWAPVSEAEQANISLRLFRPNSLLPPACAWTPNVTVWRAFGNNPAEPIGQAKPRTLDGRPFPLWDLNDVDVSRANNPDAKLYFMVRTDGVESATSIWAHSADPRTFLPFGDMPSGVASGAPRAVDTRIQIVWPHDGAGNERPVGEAELANVAVAIFEHGTRLSVPVSWQPESITLYGAWDNEIGRPLSQQATVEVKRSGAVIYPVWEFANIPVARAADPGSKLYLWVMVEGVETYPSIWAHGADARTLFPAMDQPIQGCLP